MLLAKVDAPLTVKLDDPVVFVMLLPLAMVKLAIVWAACKSQMASFAMTTSVAVAKEPERVKVPEVIVVSPV